MTKSTPPTTDEGEIAEFAAISHPFADLADTGLVWLINETVFWPRGFSLAIGHDRAGNATHWALLGDGSEPWQVSDGAVAATRFGAVNEFLKSTAERHKGEAA